MVNVYLLLIDLLFIFFTEIQKIIFSLKLYTDFTKSLKLSQKQCSPLHKFSYFSLVQCATCTDSATVPLRILKCATSVNSGC